MARLPSTAILGISMISFAGLIMLATMKHYNTVPRRNNEIQMLECFSIVMSFASAFAGVIVHAVNLDVEAAARSFGTAFIAANASLAYLYFLVDPSSWWQRAPLVLVITVAGLVLGVMSYDGDPQAELKKRAEWESDANKTMAKARESMASWEHWMREQKMKVEKGNSNTES